MPRLAELGIGCRRNVGSEAEGQIRKKKARSRVSLKRDGRHARLKQHPEAVGIGSIKKRPGTGHQVGATTIYRTGKEVTGSTKSILVLKHNIMVELQCRSRRVPWSECREPY